jgi:hypothetical protein
MSILSNPNNGCNGYADDKCIIITRLLPSNAMSVVVVCIVESIRLRFVGGIARNVLLFGNFIVFRGMVHTILLITIRSSDDGDYDCR